MLVGVWVVRFRKAVDKILCFTLSHLHLILQLEEKEDKSEDSRTLWCVVMLNQDR
jgi:hypothetical protein